MTRRVGTFTLGVSFLVIGIIIPFSLLNPDSAMKFIQLSPLLLVGLGVEILYYAITFKSDGMQKLRYDGLAIFIVVSITIVTIGSSIIIPMARNYMGIYKEMVKIRNEIEDIVYEKMSANNYDGYVNVYSPDDFYYWATGDKSELEYSLQFDLKFEQDKTEEEAVTAIYNVISDMDRRISSIGANVNCGNGSYYVSIDRGLLRNVTEKNISSRIRFIDKNGNGYDENGVPYDNRNDYNEISSSEESSETSSETSSEISSENSSGTSSENSSETSSKVSSDMSGTSSVKP